MLCVFLSLITSKRYDPTVVSSSSRLFVSSLPLFSSLPLLSPRLLLLPSLSLSLSLSLFCMFYYQTLLVVFVWEEIVNAAESMKQVNMKESQKKAFTRVVITISCLTLVLVPLSVMSTFNITGSGTIGAVILVLFVIYLGFSGIRYGVKLRKVSSIKSNQARITIVLEFRN